MVALYDIGVLGSKSGVHGLLPQLLLEDFCIGIQSWLSFSQGYGSSAF
jgi:hypothetical protein